MFNTKKNLEELRRKYERLQEQCKAYQATAEELRERIYKIEHGECYEGEHCEACKHANVVRTQETSLYSGTYTTCRTHCLLNVPCAKFERTN